MSSDPQPPPSPIHPPEGIRYTQPGAYFVTICTHDRACLFGEIVEGEMWLNEYGQIVRDEWFHTAVVRPYVCCIPMNSW